MKKYLLVLLIPVFLLVGCDQLIDILFPEGGGLPTQTANYMPLAVENSWTYAMGGLDVLPITKKVFKTVLVDGKMYYTFGEMEMFADTIRMDLQGRLMRRALGEEYVWMDFTKSDGETYPIEHSQEGFSEYVVTVSTIDSLVTKAGTFTDCKQFFFDIPGAVDDEISYTFAEDVGIVQISGAWMFQQLVSYELK